MIINSSSNIGIIAKINLRKEVKGVEVMASQTIRRVGAPIPGRCKAITIISNTTVVLHSVTAE
jgi:hypothetical protein